MFSGSLTGQRVSVRSSFVARPANARVNIIQCRSMEAGTFENRGVGRGNGGCMVLARSSIYKDITL
jgi:hypothetical protein